MLRDVVQYVWFGEVVLEASPEFIAEDTNGTLIAALLREQLAEARMGGVYATTVTVTDPVPELALYERRF